MTNGDRAAAFRDLVAGRRSIRRYRAETIPAAIIERLLEAARWAPSAHNRQPWRFALIEGASSKDRLSRAMGDRLRADRRRDGDPADAIEQDVARSHARITGAPAVIIVALDMSEMDRYSDARQDAERLMAVQSTAMAAQNLLLAAHTEGLGACWMCAPLFCPDIVAASLGLPSGWEPQALITLGWPASAGKPPTRRPVAEVIWRPPDVG